MSVPNQRLPASSNASGCEMPAAFVAYSVTLPEASTNASLLPNSPNQAAFPGALSGATVACVVAA
jgi:hypothetical protein